MEIGWRTNRARTIAGIISLLALAGGCANQPASKSGHGTWEAGCDPKVVGAKVANELLTRPLAVRSATQLAGQPVPMATQPTTRRPAVLRYPEVCTAYGSLRLAHEIGDSVLQQKLLDRYAPLLTEEGKRLAPRPTNVDSSVFGVLAFELYLVGGDERYKVMGKASADAQWVNARPDGTTKQTRLWLDDMFMITGLQVQAYRATHDKVYLDRAATEMSLYIDQLQQPSGLFFHGVKLGQFCWGRADGWMAVGMGELLPELPADHPLRAKIFSSYQRFMAALVKVQAPDGMWRQVLDDPNSWEESSCTGMIVYGMARGVSSHWLTGDEYEAAAKKGWLAMCSRVDADGRVKDVCIGTSQAADEAYYLDRPRALGDLHGQAALTWAAWAMLK